MPDDIGSVLLRNPSLLFQHIVELAVSAEFLQDVQVLLVEEESVKCDDVGMLDAGMDLQLADDLLAHLFVDDVLLGDHLQCTHKPGELVLDDEHLPEMALAQALSLDELVQTQPSRLTGS